MTVIDKAADLQSIRSELTGSVGFVPTMGYLHEGHLTLVRKARYECKHVVVSIFVNPAQFNEASDFDNYPRDIERDLELLRLAGVDYVFFPEAEEMYPAGFSTWVDIDGLTGRLEGEHRPGHFKGVTTVLTKLFNLVRPDKAYFGWKDAQQLLVTRKLVRDLNMAIEIVGVNTVREKDGLAMSSRNARLTPEDRAGATIIFKSLKTARQLFEVGERNAEIIRQNVRNVLEAEERADIEYISVADLDTLEELLTIESTALVSLAVRFGDVRLIDNVILD